MPPNPQNLPKFFASNRTDDGWRIETSSSTPILPQSVTPCPSICHSMHPHSLVCLLHLKDCIARLWASWGTDGGAGGLAVVEKIQTFLYTYSCILLTTITKYNAEIYLTCLKTTNCPMNRDFQNSLCHFGLFSLLYLLMALRINGRCQMAVDLLDASNPYVTWKYTAHAVQRGACNSCDDPLSLSRQSFENRANQLVKESYISCINLIICFIFIYIT